MAASTRSFVFVVTGLILAGLCGLAPTATAQNVPDDFTDTAVLGGLSNPLSFRFLEDGRILIAEQRSANIRLIDGGQVSPHDPVGTVPDVDSGPPERGLLSIAIDPDWPSRPFIYCYYDYDPSTKVRLTRFTATGDLDGSGDRSLSFNPATALHLISDIPDAAGNHNGGDLRWGSDGTLYVSTGDDENKCGAQDLDSWVGKVLRLKVDALDASQTGILDITELQPPSGNPFPNDGDIAALVWASGLRNPFRMQFDYVTGQLFVADVGWRDFEEVSGSDGPGTNFGWPYREANMVHVRTDCPEPAQFDPVVPAGVYGRNVGGSLSVMGGVPYRAPAGATNPWPAEYEGNVFFGDYYAGFLRRLVGSGQSWSIAPQVPGQPGGNNWANNMSRAVDYAVGPDGSLYYLAQSSGQLRRIQYEGGVPVEQNSMGGLKSQYRDKPQN